MPLKLKRKKVNQMNKHTILYKTLARALSIKRPHNTTGTQEFNAWLMQHIFDLTGIKPLVDGTGNIHVDARKGEHNRTLFVAHVDTVHKVTGPNKIRKTHTTWHAHADAPLGADDGAGCAMLMHLLCSNVPGYYIFTQGEEVGGIGASALADKKADLLSQFDRAIAFDRRGIDSVITHQGWGRCCSDAFADALCDALSADETLMYSPDDTGVYTDTAEFVDIIPECTNISVGYYSEHTSKESLDILHLQALAARCILIDWDSLPTDRDPTVRESKWDMYGAYKSLQESTSVNTYNDAYNDYMYRSGYWGTATDEDDDEETEELRDALYDAEVGNRNYLIELMCEAVYPEDPATARRLIDVSAITEELIEEAFGLLRTYNAHTVLNAIFESVMVEA